jgi:hypothetical protein
MTELLANLNRTNEKKMIDRCFDKHRATYMVPSEFHPFFARVWTIASQNQQLTKGHIILKQGLIIKNPATKLISEVLHLTATGDYQDELQVVTREYSSKYMEYKIK